MTLSQIAAVLGLDEVDVVRPVPLTDEDIAAAAARPQPNRAQRRMSREHRPRRQLGTGR